MEPARGGRLFYFSPSPSALFGDTNNTHRAAGRRADGRAARTGVRAMADDALMDSMMTGCVGGGSRARGGKEIWKRKSARKAEKKKKKKKKKKNAVAFSLSLPPFSLPVSHASTPAFHPRGHGRHQRTLCPPVSGRRWPAPRRNQQRRAHRRKRHTVDAPPPLDCRRRRRRIPGRHAGKGEALHGDQVSEEERDDERGACYQERAIGASTFLGGRLNF